MPRVRKSTYRHHMTPKGIEKIEKGTMNWFDPEMFTNFNTGALEQYLDEKNRREGFDIPAWDWKKVMLAIAIGALFAMINQYVGLKVGMVIEHSGEPHRIIELNHVTPGKGRGMVHAAHFFSSGSPLLSTLVP